MHGPTLKQDFIRAAILLILLPSIALNLFMMARIRTYIREQVAAFTESGLVYADEEFSRMEDLVAFTRDQVISEVVTSGILNDSTDRSIEGIKLVLGTAKSVYLTDLNSPFVDGIRVLLGNGYKIDSGLFSKETNADSAGGTFAFTINKNQYVTKAPDGSFRYVIVLDSPVNGSTTPVTVQLSIPLSVVSEIVQAAAYVPQVISMIVTADGKILVAPSTRRPLPVAASAANQVSSDHVPKNLARLLTSAHLKGLDSNWQGDGFTISAKKVPKLPIYFASLVPDSLVNSELLKVSLTILIASFFVFALSVALAIFASGRMTRPLYSLIESMDRVGRGDFEHRIAPITRRSNEDVKRLTLDFNLMIDRIHTLVVNLKQREKETALSSVIALQAQINPHFLYNTLDLIRGLVAGGEMEKVDETAASLAELFRYSIGKGEELVPLRDEVVALRKYLRIQQLRFGDRMKHVVRLAAEVETCLVPRLILQPIVENAFRHGIEPQVGPGTVQLTGELAKMDRQTILEVNVCDSGVGIDEATLRSIIESLDNGNGSENENVEAGLGLRNVHRRIRLSFGPPFGISITSVSGNGTTVTVRLPVRRS